MTRADLHVTCPSCGSHLALGLAAALATTGYQGNSPSLGGGNHNGSPSGRALAELSGGSPPVAPPPRNRRPAPAPAPLPVEPACPEHGRSARSRFGGGLFCPTRTDSGAFCSWRTDRAAVPA